MLPHRVAIVVAALVVGVLVQEAAGHASPVPRTDRKPPVVTIAARDGDVKLGSPTTLPVASGLTRISGTATDGWTGVRRVWLTLCSGGWKDANGGWGCGSRPIVGTYTHVTVPTELTCGPLRRRCTWTAPAPVEPEQYLVWARARDRAGNFFITPEPVLITVV